MNNQLYGKRDYGTRNSQVVKINQSSYDDLEVVGNASLDGSSEEGVKIANPSKINLKNGSLHSLMKDISPKNIKLGSINMHLNMSSARKLSLDKK